MKVLRLIAVAYLGGFVGAALVYTILRLVGAL